jgi:hypothetical protein
MEKNEGKEKPRSSCARAPFPVGGRVTCGAWPSCHSLAVFFQPVGPAAGRFVRWWEKRVGQGGGPGGGGVVGPHATHVSTGSCRRPGGSQAGSSADRRLAGTLCGWSVRAGG